MRATHSERLVPEGILTKLGRALTGKKSEGLKPIVESGSLAIQSAPNLPDVDIILADDIKANLLFVTTPEGQLKFLYNHFKTNLGLDEVRFSTIKLKFCEWLVQALIDNELFCLQVLEAYQTPAARPSADLPTPLQNQSILKLLESEIKPTHIYSRLLLGVIANRFNYLLDSSNVPQLSSFLSAVSKMTNQIVSPVNPQERISHVTFLLTTAVPKVFGPTNLAKSENISKEFFNFLYQMLNEANALNAPLLESKCAQIIKLVQTDFFKQILANADSETMTTLVTNITNTSRYIIEQERLASKVALLTEFNKITRLSWDREARLNLLKTDAFDYTKALSDLDTLDVFKDGYTGSFSREYSSIKAAASYKPNLNLLRFIWDHPDFHLKSDAYKRLIKNIVKTQAIFNPEVIFEIEPSRLEFLSWFIPEAIKLGKQSELTKFLIEDFSKHMNNLLLRSFAQEYPEQLTPNLRFGQLLTTVAPTLVRDQIIHVLQLVGNNYYTRTNKLAITKAVEFNTAAVFLLMCFTSTTISPGYISPFLGLSFVSAGLVLGGSLATHYYTSDLLRTHNPRLRVTNTNTLLNLRNSPTITYSALGLFISTIALGTTYSLTSQDGFIHPWTLLKLASCALMATHAYELTRSSHPFVPLIPYVLPSSSDRTLTATYNYLVSNQQQFFNTPTLLIGSSVGALIVLYLAGSYIIQNPLNSLLFGMILTGATLPIAVTSNMYQLHSSQLADVIARSATTSTERPTVELPPLTPPHSQQQVRRQPRIAFLREDEGAGIGLHLFSPDAPLPPTPRLAPDLPRLTPRSCVLESAAAASSTALPAVIIGSNSNPRNIYLDLEPFLAAEMSRRAASGPQQQL